MLPYPQKFPHRPNPTAGRPNGKPHNITRLCPGAKGTPIEPAGGVRLSPWQENHFPPLLEMGSHCSQPPTYPLITIVSGYDLLKSLLVIWSHLYLVETHWISGCNEMLFPFCHVKLLKQKHGSQLGNTSFGDFDRLIHSHSPHDQTHVSSTYSTLFDKNRFTTR